MADNIIRIRGLSKSFGHLQALRNIDLDVARSEVVVVIGPSGSGKSTLLRCINHLETPTAGEIIIDGVSVAGRGTDLNALRAEVGMVFQSFNLFPHLSVLENIVLAQRVVRKRPRREAEQVAHELLNKVDIPEKAHAYPGQLSGEGVRTLQPGRRVRRPKVRRCGTRAVHLQAAGRNARRQNLGAARTGQPGDAQDFAAVYGEADAAHGGQVAVVAHVPDEGEPPAGPQDAGDLGQG